MKNAQFGIHFDVEFPLMFNYELKNPLYPIDFGTLHVMNHLFIDKDIQKQILFGIKPNFRIDFIQKGLAIELLGGLDGYYKYHHEISTLENWLIEEFNPELVPLDDLYMVRKDFVSDIYKAQMYSRYSIIQRYKCENFDEFWTIILRLFRKNFTPEKQFIYMELMFGSSDRDEPRAYAGIPLRNEDSFHKYKIGKINYDFLIKKRKHFIKKLKPRVEK